MNVEIERVGGGPIRFEDFAEKHGLRIKVVERGGNWTGTDGQYYAQFDGAEEKGVGVLISGYGDGKTPELAIASYRHRLRGLRLVFGAYTNNRREIQCPTEWLP